MLKRHILFSVITLSCIVLFFSSCNDDDAADEKLELSFAVPTLTAQEGDGSVNVQVRLNKPATADLIVQYSLAGSATEKSTVLSGDIYDYEDRFNGTIEIARGASAGNIQIILFPDQNAEDTESIEITLESADNTNVEITAENTVTIFIEDDDEPDDDDDDDDEDEPIIGFVSTTLVLNEDEGVFEIQLTLDKPATTNITLEYELSGTAVDSVEASVDEIDADYAILDEEPGEIEIAAGQSTGVIRIRIYSDFSLEDDETINIELTGATNASIDTEKDELNITLEQQDAKVVTLFWSEDYASVDMDLFLWIGNTTSTLNTVAAISAAIGNEPPVEQVCIPYIIEAAYGFSYTYYSGEENPMDFSVEFIDYINGDFVDESALTFNDSYTLANINAWDEEDAPEPVIVQTIENIDGEFTTPSEIDTPANGSRKATKVTDKNLIKGKSFFKRSTFLNQ